MVEKKFEKKPEKPESRRITYFFGGIVLNSEFFFPYFSAGMNE